MTEDNDNDIAKASSDARKNKAKSTLGHYPKKNTVSNELLSDQLKTKAKKHSSSEARPKPKPKPSVNPNKNTRKTAGWEDPNNNDQSISSRYTFGIVVSIFIFLTLIAVNTAEKPIEAQPKLGANSHQPVTPKTESPTIAIKKDKPKSLIYKKPTVGKNNVLSTAEIRWCLKHAIRIDIIRTYSSNTQSAVDAFNLIVDDYNSRCGAYRYRTGSLSRAKKDIEPERYKIITEARNIGINLGGSSSTARSSVNSSSPPKVKSKKPPKNITRQAQQILKKLGYPIGVVDGDYGKNTRNSVMAFQRDRGYPVDGWISKKLISQLLSIPSTTSPQRTSPPNSKLPKNSKLDYTGKKWVCISGYKRYGNECVVVNIPTNGRLDYTGHNWKCNSGYKRYGNDCIVVNIPRNAQLDYTGHNWKCNSGYKRYGNDCIVVNIPRNAQLDYTGHNWKCNSGYKRYGNECAVVNIPENAQLDYTGHNWKCNSGYKRYGNECAVVNIPRNAQLDYTGHNWKCNSGYKRYGNECVVVNIPRNAQLDYTGHNWKCNSGYKRYGNECVVVNIPRNAQLDYTGHNWKCNSGYKRYGNQCLKL